MNCWFGVRPIKADYKSFERWNKAVEQYVADNEEGMRNEL